VTSESASLRSFAHSIASRAQKSAIGFWLNQRRLRVEARSGYPAGAFRGVKRADRVVALSYDDGPSPANTPELLEILATKQAHATFFVVGSRVERHPELVERIAAAGHELGNHSFSHKNPLELDDDELRDELERGADAITQAGGHASLFRPPFGKRPRAAARLCAALGFVTVLWSIDSGDTRSVSSRRIAREVIQHVQPGDIVLMHDGGARRQQTLDATRQILDELTDRGYRFVKVSDLLPKNAD
jgi:peptidoglycan/xylan/chitin deacetylase (PgdA/CDA1 family)